MAVVDEVGGRGFSVRGLAAALWHQPGVEGALNLTLQNFWGYNPV